MNTAVPGHHRYPGSRPFYDNEIDRQLFFGRDKEIQLLLHETLTSRLVILYGKSGLGKTSLINAGLNRELRDRGFVPLKIRLNAPGVEPQQAVFEGIRVIVKKENLDYESGEENSLWQFFKTAAFWGPGNTLLKPVLILDQFEEFFILNSAETRKNFSWRLADLVNNTIPSELTSSLPAGGPFPYSDKPPNVKIIISIREDYLGHLEEMSEGIPGILQHRFRLMPLSCEQARQAIVKPSRVQADAIGTYSFTYSADAVDAMLNFLCRRKERSGEKMTDEVESFQLQLLCCHLEDKVREKPGTGESKVVVEKGDLGGEKGMQWVLRRFFDEQVKQLDSVFKRNRTRRLCEKGLISVEDRRLSLEEGEIERNYKVTKSLLAELVNRRLLRSEPRVGSIYYELSHDTLVAPIRESRKKRNFIKKITSVLGIIFILLAAGYLVEREFRIDRINRINKFYTEAGRLRKAGYYKEAIDQYNAILKIDNNYANAYIEIGDILHEQGKYDGAIDAYKKAIDIDPGYIHAKINLAALYLIRKDFKNADKMAIEVLNVKDISPQYILAMNFVSISSLLVREKHQQLIAQLTEFIDYYKSLSRDYFKTWDYSLSRKFISDSPLEEYKKLLLLQFIDILESPLAEGQRKLKEKEALIYNIIGHAHLALGKINEAKEALKKAVDIDPGYVFAKRNLAALLLITNDFIEAGKLAGEVLETEKRAESRLIMRGVFITSLMHQGRPLQVITQLSEFIDEYRSLSEEYKKTWNYELSKFIIRISSLQEEEIEMLHLFLDIIGSRSLEEGRRKLEKLEEKRAALIRLYLIWRGSW